MTLENSGMLFSNLYNLSHCDITRRYIAQYDEQYNTNLTNLYIMFSFVRTVYCTWGYLLMVRLC